MSTAERKNTIALPNQEKVQAVFLNESLPLDAQPEKLDCVLNLTWETAKQIFAGKESTDYQVGVSVETLKKGGFITEKEGLVFKGDSKTRVIVRQAQEALFLEEYYPRTEMLEQKDTTIFLVREMVKVFKIRQNEGFSIRMEKFYSPQAQVVIIPKTENVPDGFKEFAGNTAAYTQDKPTEYESREVTAKDVNRLLYILFTGLCRFSLTPPSSPIERD